MALSITRTTMSKFLKPITTAVSTTCHLLSTTTLTIEKSLPFTGHSITLKTNPHPQNRQDETRLLSYGPHPELPPHPTQNHPNHGVDAQPRRTLAPREPETPIGQKQTPIGQKQTPIGEAAMKMLFHGGSAHSHHCRYLSLLGRYTPSSIPCSSSSVAESITHATDVDFLTRWYVKDMWGMRINEVTVYFQNLLPRAEAEKWFQEVVPHLAILLLKLPSLLESHYDNADGGVLEGVKTGLRLLESQEPGIVFLNQELVGALLACSLFCLFPTSNRAVKDLQMINFDYLFACLHDHYEAAVESKLKCIVHYFGRICSSLPVGYVSFERKVLSLECSPSCIPYPKENVWSQSTISLCHIEISSSGLIEDQSCEAIEVDFANMYLGGGALVRGCVQEEIGFMINPELIAGMLFLPCMADNEAIEIVGTERFSSYTGYASSFRFNGDYVDKKDIDIFGRRKTRIAAIDALCRPGRSQYQLECLLRETNKAYCGFFDQFKYHQHQQFSKDDGCRGLQHDQNVKYSGGRSIDNLPSLGHTSTSSQANEETLGNQLVRNHEGHGCQLLDNHHEIGVVTGNWGCGAFGGDPQLKAIIQWIAASQALRPFILYYTFELEALQKLDQVAQWIVSQKWTVGELWNVLVEYSSQRSNGKTRVGFFNWLLPSLYSHEAKLNSSYDG